MGFAGKRATPGVSLGWWFLAVQLVDLLWPIFLLLGGEEVRILLIYLQGLFGPPPPDDRSLAWFALIGWLLPPWGSWIDRTRRSDPA